MTRNMFCRIRSINIPSQPKMSSEHIVDVAQTGLSRTHPSK